MEKIIDITLKNRERNITIKELKKIIEEIIKHNYIVGNAEEAADKIIKIFVNIINK